MELIVWDILIKLADVHALFPDKVHAWHKKVKEHFGVCESSSEEASDGDLSDLEFLSAMEDVPADVEPNTYHHPWLGEMSDAEDAGSAACDSGVRTLDGEAPVMNVEDGLEENMPTASATTATVAP